MQARQTVYAGSCRAEGWGGVERGVGRLTGRLADRQIDR